MKKNLLGISLITMTCLYGLLAAVIILIFIFTGLPVTNGIITSIIVLIIQFLISPFLTDLSMKWFYKAKFDGEIPEYLRNFINQICEKYNMKYPKIGIIEDGAPNAFTYGRTKNDARIVLTRGIFNLLNEQEVIAVVGHELGHAKHYDMFFMTVAQLVPLVLYGIYETFTKSSNKNSSSRNKSEGYLELIGMIAYVLYLISQYIILWLSRTREYYADSFAIEETKNPNSLTTALIKIGYGLSINNEPEAEDEKKKKKHTIANSKVIGIFDSNTSKALVSTSYNNGVISTNNIKNAMKWETWNIWAKLYELKSTHPLISKRLKAISNRCQEYNQTPFITFDLTKTESYVDDFIIEVIINYLPSLALIITLIAATISGIYTDYALKIVGIGGVITMILSFIKLGRRYKNAEYQETTVSDLLGEVKVSGITSIPCTLEGTIIGRGNPGCIFNEDFVIKDNTGIMFLDYNQPLKTVNKIFALFKSKEYFDKIIKVKGWYRRSPVPYVEIYTMEIDGKIKKCYTYATAKIVRIILLIVFAAMILIF